MRHPDEPLLCPLGLCGRIVEGISLHGEILQLRVVAIPQIICHLSICAFSGGGDDDDGGCGVEGGDPRLDRWHSRQSDNNNNNGSNNREQQQQQRKLKTQKVVLAEVAAVSSGFIRFFSQTHSLILQAHVPRGTAAGSTKTSHSLGSGCLLPPLLLQWRSWLFTHCLVWWLFFDRVFLAHFRFLLFHTTQNSFCLYYTFFFRWRFLFDFFFAWSASYSSSSSELILRHLRGCV